MKKELFQEIEIPEGVEITLNDGEVAVKGKEGELKRTFNVARIIFEKKDNKIIIGNKKATKTEKKLMNSITAHIKNMILGVQNKFEDKLKICFSHFPFTVDIQGNVATIKNFLGEKINRKCIIPKDADVKINKQEITVTAINKEIAGQAAANFENATKIRNRDKRVFQDGIYITEKNGKLM